MPFIVDPNAQGGGGSSANEGVLRQALDSFVTENQDGSFSTETDSVKTYIDDNTNVEIGSTATKSNTELLINPSATTTYNIPEIDDTQTSTVDTWSSQKIKEYVDAQIAALRALIE